MAHILAVSGSPSPTSRTAAILDRVGRRVREDGHTIDILHVRTLPAAPLLAADQSDPFIADAAERLGRADAVVLGTPVYKASYSGLLKVWLDSVAQLAFTGKTVLPLATGGSLANVLALDYALRPVLAAMGAAHVVQGYFVLDQLVVPGPGDGWSLDPVAQPALDDIVDAFLRVVAVAHPEPRAASPILVRGEACIDPLGIAEAGWNAAA
jgi:FMN reductase